MLAVVHRKVDHEDAHPRVEGTGTKHELVESGDDVAGRHELRGFDPYGRCRCLGVDAFLYRESIAR